MFRELFSVFIEPKLKKFFWLLAFGFLLILFLLTTGLIWGLSNELQIILNDKYYPVDLIIGGTIVVILIFLYRTFGRLKKKMVEQEANTASLFQNLNQRIKKIEEQP